MKLRARMMASDEVEDLRQETLIRVFAALRKQDGVRRPESFGAFVNSVCNNVLSEYYRSAAKDQPIEDPRLEDTDRVFDLEGMLVTKQFSEHVRRILDGRSAASLANNCRREFSKLSCDRYIGASNLAAAKVARGRRRRRDISCAVSVSAGCFSKYSKK